MIPERRRLHRVAILEVMRGHSAGRKLFVADMSLTGLRITHQEPFEQPGAVIPIVFEWDGRTISLECELRWSTAQRVGSASYARTLHQSGLMIVRGDPASMSSVREIVLSCVLRAIDEQRANARGIPAAAARVYRTGAPTLLMRHEHAGGSWTAQTTSDNSQPASGFTISADHNAEEVSMLQQAWTTGDESARQLIRKLAAESIGGPVVPARRYAP